MLFGVKLIKEETVDFFLITADTEEDATDYLNEQGYADFEVYDAEQLVDDNFGGLAALVTA